MSSPIVATAPVVDFQSFKAQAQSNPRVQEIVAKIQTIVEEYQSGEHQISEEEGETKVAQLKALLANLKSQIPAGFDFEAFKAKMATPQQPAQFDIEALKANLPADFDFAKFKANLPADLDIEDLKAKIPADFDLEAFRSKLPVNGLKAPTFTATEVTIPEAPANDDFVAIIGKAKAILEAQQAKGVTLEGINPEIIEKVKAMIAAKKAGVAAPALPENPEFQAVMAQVKTALVSLSEDSTFSTLSLQEKIKAVMTKINEEK